MFPSIDLVHILVTAGLCALTFVLGMRVEVRGASGIQQDVQALITKISQDVTNVKAQIAGLKAPTPVVATTAATPSAVVVPAVAAPQVVV
jgi:hypothetical protein